MDDALPIPSTLPTAGAMALGEMACQHYAAHAHHVTQSAQAPPFVGPHDVHWDVECRDVGGHRVVIVRLSAQQVEDETLDTPPPIVLGAPR